jgi:hypothetical protein
MENAERLAVLEKHGITVESVFVPLSQSRHKDTKDHRGNPVQCLNWRVTLKKGGRAVLTTDYMAGSGHCPAYHSKMPASWPNRGDQWKRDAVAFECETGRKASYMGHLLGFHKKTDSIRPDALDVVSSLVADSGVLDYGTSEAWAYDFGYDTDSRSAEKIYRACLEIALKLRNGLGEAVLAELNEAFQDY